MDLVLFLLLNRKAYLHYSNSMIRFGHISLSGGKYIKLSRFLVFFKNTNRIENFGGMNYIESHIFVKPLRSGIINRPSSSKEKIKLLPFAINPHSNRVNTVLNMSRVVLIYSLNFDISTFNKNTSPNGMDTIQLFIFNE